MRAQRKESYLNLTTWNWEGFPEKLELKQNPNGRMGLVRKEGVEGRKGILGPG